MRIAFDQVLASKQRASMPTAGRRTAGCMKALLLGTLLVAAVAPAAAQCLFNNNGIFGNGVFTGVFTPTICNPTVTVVQQPSSTWTWSIEAPGTVQPNPLPLGTTGTLVYKVTVTKGASGPPTGIFTISGSIWMQSFGRRASIKGIYLMLQGPNINQRFDVSDCTPGDRILQAGSPLTCNFNIPTVSLKGQANGNTVLFSGYTLQAFSSYDTIPSDGSDGSAANFLAESGQGTSLPATLTFPTIGTDCAVLTQVFDGSQTLPSSVTSVAGPSFQSFTVANPVAFNPTQICNTQSLTWTASFRFSRSDCNGDTSGSYLKRIDSNFRLQPDSSTQPPLVFDSSEQAAYLVCSGTTGEVQQLAAVPTPASAIKQQPQQQQQQGQQQSLQLFQQQLQLQQQQWQQQLQLQQQQWDRLQQQQQQQWERQQRQTGRASAFIPTTTQLNGAPRTVVAGERAWPAPVPRAAPKPAPAPKPVPATVPRPVALNWQGVTYQRTTMYTWSIGGGVVKPNPVTLGSNGAAMVTVSSTYTRAAPSTAGTLSGSVTLVNPNAATRYVSDVRVAVRYSDGRQSAEVKANCPRGQFGNIELPPRPRQMTCSFSITAPMRANTRLAALQARALMPEGRTFSVATNMAQLSNTPGFRQQQVAGSTGECAIVSESMKEVTISRVWGTGPFDRQLRVCGSKSYNYELQLLGQLLGSCDTKAKLVQSVAPQGGSATPVTRSVPLTVKGCARQGG